MTGTEVFEVLVYLFAFTVIGAIFYAEHKLGMPPAPTLPWTRKKIIEGITKYAEKEELKIAELGSGWGGLAFAVSKNFPKAEIQGYELSFFPYWFSKLQGLFYPRITFSKSDIFEQDLTKYDVVVYYLAPVISERLSKKFREELKPGTLIVSSGFALPGFEPIETLEVKVIVKNPVFVYRV